MLSLISKQKEREKKSLSLRLLKIVQLTCESCISLWESSCVRVSAGASVRVAGLASRWQSVAVCNERESPGN